MDDSMMPVEIFWDEEEYSELDEPDEEALSLEVNAAMEQESGDDESEE